MLALQLFVVGDLSRGGGWAEVGGEGFPVAGRGVGISGIFWTLRGEGEATGVTSGPCGGGKPRASCLDSAGEPCAVTSLVVSPSPTPWARSRVHAA